MVTYHVLGAVLGENPTVGVILPPVAFLFFVISGFVIYRPWSAADATGRPTPDVGRFYRSRLLRVLPLWWVALAAYLAVHGTGPLDGPRDWILTLLLLQITESSIRYAVIGPAWALSVEWLFYLCVPVYAVVVAHLRRRVAPHRSALAFQVGALLPVAVVAAVVEPLRPLLGILVGMAFAVLDVRRHLGRPLPAVLRALASPWVALAATAAAWVLLAIYPYRSGLSVQWVEQDLRLLLFWIVVAVVWFVPVAFGRPTGVARRGLAVGWLVAASQLTFGIYLWHDLVLSEIVERLGRDANVWSVLYLTFLGSLVLATLTFVVVERPLMALRDRQFAGRRSWAMPRAERAAARSAADAGATPTEAGSTPDAAPGTSPAPATAPDPTAPPAETAPGPRLGWIAQIDGLRVVAAGFVVLFHVLADSDVPDWTTRAANSLIIPVFAVFFAVSGFVLYRPWALAHARVTDGDGRLPQRPVDGGIGRFVLGRVLRVYPLYLVVQGVALLQADQHSVEGVGGWVQVVTLFPWPRYENIFDNGLGVIVWTLTIEMAWYLVLPFYGRLLLAGARRGIPYRLLQGVPIVVAAVAFSVFARGDLGFLAVYPCLLVGVATAAVDGWQRTVKRWVPGLRRAVGATWAVLPIVGLTWAVGYDQARSLPADALFTANFSGRLVAMVVVATVLFVPAVLGPPRSRYRRVLGAPLCRRLGPLTFGVYLWHYPVIRFVQDHLDLPAAALLPVALAAATALAWVTFRLVEQPIERLRSTRGAAARAGRATTPTARVRP